MSGHVPSHELLEVLGHAVIVTDVEGRITYWNPAAERLYGWEAEEVLGRPIEDVTVVEAAREVAGVIMSALRRHTPWSGGFPVRRKDGSVFLALVTDTGIYDGDDLVGIVGVSTNLGVALRPLLERSTDAALVLNARAVVTYASPAVGALFGWDESVIGTSITPLLHPEDRAALADFLEQAVRQPGPHPAVEVRVRHAEEGWVWVEAAVTNLLDDPDVRGLVCNLRLSPHREAHESARRQVEQLNTALRSRAVIEQAKGYLSARHGIDPETAFELLRRQARNTQQKVHAVAQQVIEGKLDIAPKKGPAVPSQKTPGVRSPR